jgi:hypothetical protein
MLVYGLLNGLLLRTERAQVGGVAGELAFVGEFGLGRVRDATECDKRYAVFDGTREVTFAMEEEVVGCHFILRTVRAQESFHSE